MHYGLVGDLRPATDSALQVARLWGVQDIDTWAERLSALATVGAS